MGTCISGGGGSMPYTTFGTWGRGYEVDKILKCYTFDLFMLSINIHLRNKNKKRSIIA